MSKSSSRKPRNASLKKAPSGKVARAGAQRPLTLAQARKLTQQHPQEPSSWKALGAGLIEAGEFEEALEALNHALSLAPQDHEVYELLARTEDKLGNAGKAMEQLKQALEIKPESAQAHFHLAKMLFDRTQNKEALEHIEQANHLLPSSNDILSHKGNVLNRLYRYDEAIAVFDELIERQPGNYSHWNNAGNLKKDIGQLDDADAYYRKSIELAGSTMALPYSNRLALLHYHPGFSREAIFEVCKEWDSRFAPTQVIPRPQPVEKIPQQRIRIGMFSDGFRNHPVGRMVVTALESLKKHEIEIYAYSTNNAVDPLTARIRTTSSQWLPVKHLSDEEFAQRIRDDEIDILIDLCGHNTGSRMRVMAQEPAPVLVKWVGGLINTTGLKAIDYLLSDSIESPQGDDAFYTEKLIRMPDDYICYALPDKTSEVQPLPALSNGYITLGCFNNPTKVNSVVLAEWAKLMHDMPASRLFLKGHQYNSIEFCQRIRDTMASHDISDERLIIEGPSKHVELLEAYNRVDIALDPWPYSGGLTTCEAMLMGVPVVTLPGPTFAGRHSATHLTNAGMPELVTSNWDEYRQRVIGLASDLQSLSTIRTHLRDILLQSPVCDAPRFAKHFTIAMRAIWQRYCDDKQPAALTLDKEGTAQFGDEEQSVEILHPKPMEDDAEDQSSFRWQFQGKITAIDNGAGLTSTPNVTNLLKLGAFSVIAFDPAGKVDSATQLKVAGELHHYPHAVLGDGSPATLYACLDPAMNATLRPLQAIKTLTGEEAGPKVLTELPINTIQLDKIEGLEAIDWLILDNLNDSLAVLEHGEKALANTLLIQARVNFQPTHENQPELTQISHWMSRHGFSFYRLNDPAHLSHLPKRDDLIRQQATQLVSADAIYIPNAERMAELDDNQRMKLAFVLHTVYGVKDLAYELLLKGKEDRSEAYLRSEGALMTESSSSTSPKIQSFFPELKTQKTSISTGTDCLSISSEQKTTSHNQQTNRHAVEYIKNEEGFFWNLDTPIYVVDVGANPIDGTPPYTKLLKKGAIKLVGFEPQREALKKLQAMKGDNEIYLPHAVGDGKKATLYLCQASGMTSTLKPNNAVLNHFQGYPIWGKVKHKETIDTIRLDDVGEIEKIDWLKIDIQGGELNVFKNAEEKLKYALVIQTEVNFIQLYEDQPLFAEIDQWMRKHGFILHTLLEQRKRLYAPMKIGGQIHQGINQLTTADAVYIRDINMLDALTDGQKKKMALILHSAYGSYDLALRILKECEDFDQNAYLGNLKDNDFTVHINKKQQKTIGQIDGNIFVVGCGHTGTTLITSILGANSKIYAITRETNWFLSNNSNFSQEYVQEITKSASIGKSIICEKTPSHLHRIKTIRDAFPKAKIIIMTRDAKDVIYSIKNRSGNFQAALARWKNDNQEAIKHLGNKDIMLVRYEDLVEHPENFINKICKFIGVAFEQNMMEFHKSDKKWFGVESPKETDGKGEENHVIRRAWQMSQPIHDRRGIWKGRLNHEEIVTIENNTRELMEKLGYIHET